MNSSGKTYYNSAFSHIYVEKAVRSHPRTAKIIEQFKNAQIVEIDHYKDLFCRKRQNISLQNKCKNLILAEKREPFVYHGSPVCQNFDEQHFYYTSCAMNCLYDCEYCYLKGMYPSGNMVIFVNLEDVLKEVRGLLKEHGVYLCISYDTDLMALENITGFVREWTDFAGEEPELKIECRTKCGRTDLWRKFTPQENVIFAFTLSPETVIHRYEHRTASLEERLRGVKVAMEAGFPVRLCFDPMIYVRDWRSEYESFVEQVAETVDMEQLYDVSVGSFRISQDYLKKMRRVLPESAVVQFPFENTGGFYHYPTALMNEMEKFLTEKLEQFVPGRKIFRWQN